MFKLQFSTYRKNQRKIAQLKEKLGDKYRIIGRDKRQSPITEKYAPSRQSQPPKPIPPIPQIKGLLVEEGLFKPHSIIPGKLKESIQELKKVKESQTEQVVATKKSIREAVQILDNKKEETTFATIMDLPKDAVPEPVITKIDDTEIELKTVKGPFYNYGLAPSEANFLLKEAPKALYSASLTGHTQERSEMLRRILSIENADSNSVRKFNKLRLIELFQRKPNDTGSSEVQAAVMNVKIEAMRKHMEKHKKDTSTKRKLEAWISKQRGILKYLKRKDLKKYVEVCEALGINPKNISPF
ncbi:30S ribosomal protein S15 [Boothiomyces macroporosus]|uniref:30S ribosomal protein S15 n=1 Tax=Boothiomyces macroporosus TaxID=261099 RepID=A0AAD5UL72_9FUNG|nr:30S ribosomal protein S15 [Boothiomyces macroporosus]